MQAQAAGLVLEPPRGADESHTPQSDDTGARHE
jgi:hypothetical protein